VKAMKRHANETLTGLFVLVTAVVVTAVIVYLSAPQVIRKQNTYYVFFENAGGIRSGTEVLLGGRHVGQVVKLESPVPLAGRPEEHQDFEARVEVRIDRRARIYNEVEVRLQPYGMLGDMLIDFVQGDEGSGLAPSGTTFVGERIAGLDEAAEQATRRLAELQSLVKNLTDLTGTGGDLSKSVANTRQFTDTIKRQPWRLVWKSTKEYPQDEKKAKDKRHKEKDSEEQEARNH